MSPTDAAGDVQPIAGAEESQIAPQQGLHAGRGSGHPGPRARGDAAAATAAADRVLEVEWTAVVSRATKLRRARQLRHARHAGSGGAAAASFRSPGMSVGTDPEAEAPALPPQLEDDAEG